MSQPLWTTPTTCEFHSLCCLRFTLPESPGRSQYFGSTCAPCQKYKWQSQPSFPSQFVSYLIPQLLTRRRKGNNPHSWIRSLVLSNWGHSVSVSLISVVANVNLIVCFTAGLKLPLIKVPSQLEGWVYQLILICRSYGIILLAYLWLVLERSRPIQRDVFVHLLYSLLYSYCKSISSFVIDGSQPTVTAISRSGSFPGSFQPPASNLHMYRSWEYATHTQSAARFGRATTTVS